MQWNVITACQKVLAEVFYLFIRDPPCMKKCQPTWRVNIEPILAVTWWSVGWCIDRDLSRLLKPA